LAENNNLINQVFKVVSKSPRPPVDMEINTPCDIYSLNDYDKYIQGVMPSDKARKIEIHCQDCSSCLKGILHSHEKLKMQKELSENEMLFQRTLSLLNRIDREQEENILDIIINASKEILEIISTTGDLLNVYGILPSRGKDDSAISPKIVQVKQRFDLPPISVQATFERIRQEKKIHLNISLYDEQTEEFMPGIEITLAGLEIHEKVTSDKNGEASFTIKELGDYQANFQNDKKRIARLKVSIK